MKRKINYTRGEELWNSWSHAAGILLAVVVGTLFIIWAARHENGWATFGVSLYLFGMLGSYVASTVYHALSAENKWKERLRRWDHAAIYWHIAGSYSPITLVAMRDQGLWGWALFAFVWTAAIAGTIVSFHKLKPHSNVETICFCLMGLSVLVAFKPLLHCVSTAAVVWIIAEGVCYITGALLRASLGFLSPLRSESATLRDVERPLSERSGERKGRKGRKGTNAWCKP